MSTMGTMTARRTISGDEPRRGGDVMSDPCNTGHRKLQDCPIEVVLNGNAAPRTWPVNGRWIAFLAKLEKAKVAGKHR